jgi:hypothetical protein
VTTYTAVYELHVALGPRARRGSVYGAKKGTCPHLRLAHMVPKNLRTGRGVTPLLHTPNSFSFFFFSFLQAPVSCHSLLGLGGGGVNFWKGQARPSQIRPCHISSLSRGETIAASWLVQFNLGNADATGSARASKQPRRAGNAIVCLPALPCPSGPGRRRRSCRCFVWSFGFRSRLRAFHT